VAAAILTNKDSLDYGYRIGVELNRNEMIIWSEVWEFCEGLFIVGPYKVKFYYTLSTLSDVCYYGG
jgi:hypothetical protein